jgi:hypothetical protein
MTILTNPRHEKFALLVASGLTPTKAYVEAGFSARGARQSAHRLLRDPDVSLRVAEATMDLSERTTSGIVSCRVTDVNARLKEWQERWDEIRNTLDAIIVERGEQLGGESEGAEDGHVAGGSTGFIALDYKGKNADVPVYRIDPGIPKLLQVLLDIGKRVAMELGQWEGKRGPNENLVRPDFSKLTDEELELWMKLFDKAKPTVQ